MTFDGVVERELRPLVRSPLRLALAQARIPKTDAAEDIERIRVLADTLDGWHLRERQISRETNVFITPDGVQESKLNPETVSVLRPEDGGLRAAVSASSVTVECDVYTEWSRFRDAVREVFDACERVIRPAVCERLGVRYVNELRDTRAGGKPEELAELLNAALAAPAVALDRLVLGSQTELRTAEGDGEFVLRHGLVRHGEYLLDYDCFTVHPQKFESDTLVAQADRFHARIESVFAWSLNPAYLNELMGEQENGDV